MKKKKLTVYLAGPMRGYPYDNFLQFDAYKARLEMAGLNVISPADIDREFGYDPVAGLTKKNPTVEKCLSRDVEAIIKSDAVVVMPRSIGKSVGVMAEIAAAIFLDKPVYQLPAIK